MGSQTLWMFAAVIGILAGASALGYGLRQQAGSTRSPAIANFNQRVKAWWVMVAALAIAFSLGKAGVILLFAFVSFAAFREFVTLTKTRRGDHLALAGSFFLVLPAQYALVWIDWYGLYSIFIPVYVFLLLPIVAAVRGDTTRFLERVAEVQWGLMISIYCLSHLPALMMLDIPGYEAGSLQLIAYLIIVVQLSDVLQYVFGKLVGRTPIAPSVSPAKTWEGFILGVLGATLIGSLLWWMTPFGPLQSALVSLTICLMGFFGGLVMSAIKRDRGVKDWGWMIEGHGGMLDRLDSVVFAAPVFLHIVRYWYSA